MVPWYHGLKDERSVKNTVKHSIVAGHTDINTFETQLRYWGILRRPSEAPNAVSVLASLRPCDGIQGQECVPSTGYQSPLAPQWYLASWHISRFYQNFQGPQVRGTKSAYTALKQACCLNSKGSMGNDITLVNAKLFMLMLMQSQYNNCGFGTQPMQILVYELLCMMSPEKKGQL